MPFTSVFIVTLVLGFIAVGLVGFMGWRKRMRDLRIGPIAGARERREPSWLRPLTDMRPAGARRRS
jgi:hypothetical protein